MTLCPALGKLLIWLRLEKHGSHNPETYLPPSHTGAEVGDHDDQVVSGSKKKSTM